MEYMIFSKSTSDVHSSASSQTKAEMPWIDLSFAVWLPELVLMPLNMMCEPVILLMMSRDVFLK